MFKHKIESELYKYYEAKDNPKILIVYGARQNGKSYIIRETAKPSFKHYAEIDLKDDFENNKRFFYYAFIVIFPMLSECFYLV